MQLKLNNTSKWSVENCISKCRFKTLSGLSVIIRSRMNCLPSPSFPFCLHLPSPFHFKLSLFTSNFPLSLHPSPLVLTFLPLSSSSSVSFPFHLPSSFLFTLLPLSSSPSGLPCSFPPPSPLLFIFLHLSFSSTFPFPLNVALLFLFNFLLLSSSPFFAFPRHLSSLFL